VFCQVSSHVATSGQAVCKTVGSAYVGSNPTPATSKAAGQTLRLGRVPCAEGAVCDNGGITARLQARDNYRLYGTRLCRTDLCRSAACGVSGRLDWVAVALSLVVEQWSRELGFFSAIAHRSSVRLASDFAAVGELGVSVMRRERVRA